MSKRNNRYTIKPTELMKEFHRISEKLIKNSPVEGTFNFGRLLKRFFNAGYILLVLFCVVVVVVMVGIAAFIVVAFFALLVITGLRLIKFGNIMFFLRGGLSLNVAIVAI